MKKSKSLSSKEVKEELKIKSCDLMHLREQGILKADKKGNAFLYDAEDVKKYQKNKNIKL